MAEMIHAIWPLIRSWLLLAAAIVPMVVIGCFIGCLAALWVWDNVRRRER